MLWSALMLAFTAGVAGPPPQAEIVSAPMSREHTAWVSAWLRRRPAWRLAVRRDCADCQTELPPADRFPPPPPPPPDPFYVRRDLDGDGREDAAVVVIARTDPTRRLVLVFRELGAPALAWPIPPAATLRLWPRAGERKPGDQSRVMLGLVDTDASHEIVWHRDRFIVRPTGG